MKDDKMPKFVLYDKDKKDLREAVLYTEMGGLVPNENRINFSDITCIGNLLINGDPFGDREGEQGEVRGRNSLCHNAERDAKDMFDADYIQLSNYILHQHGEIIPYPYYRVLGKNLYPEAVLWFQAVASLYIKNQAKK